MSPRKFFMPLAAAVAVLFFLYALFQLLLLRYERGDIYPAYSTLRADPLGCRAFYEALDSMPGYTTARGLGVLHRELLLKPQTILYLGMSNGITFSEDEVAALDDYVKNGGRVVLTFSPEDSYSDFEEHIRDRDKKKDEKKTDKKNATDKKDAPKNEEKGKPDSTPPPKTQQEKHERDEQKREQDEDKDNVLPDYHPSIGALWGFDTERHSETDEKKGAKKSAGPSDPDEEKPEVFADGTLGTGLEDSVPWKSAAYLVRLEPEFQVLYRAKGKPVMARRSWGKGEVIIATDSYFMSNEALRNDRKPALLELVSGPAGLLVFDETHLGTEVQEGIMALIERFRLEGYLIGATVVLLLFLWRNSVPLVPPHEAQPALGGAVSGKDSRGGLVNLLRRNIAPRDIIQTSFTEWKRGVTPSRTHLHAKMKEMESVLASLPPDGTRDLVPLYHHLREINQPKPGAKTYGTKPGTAHTPPAIRPD